MGGTLLFWPDQGTELPVAGITVSPGTAVALTQTVNQADAQIASMADWGSGKPGTATRLWLVNYPAGLDQRHHRQPTSRSRRAEDFGTVTTNGAEVDSQKKITIPSRAAPGYAYWVTRRPEGRPLAPGLTSFQTCTLKPSKAPCTRAPASPSAAWCRSRVTTAARRARPSTSPVYKTTSAKTASAPADATRGGRPSRAGPRSPGSGPTALGKYRKGSVGRAQDHVVLRLVPA